MKIDARNLAGALVYLRQDVETALLELVATSPKLDSRVRSQLLAHNEGAKLREIDGKLYFVCRWLPKWTCAMHAVDLVCQVLPEALVVEFLLARFPEARLEALVEE